MEFWFMQEKESIHLPVPPSSFEINTGNMNSTVAVEGIGEINLLGKSKLATISIASFFPAQEYSFCQGDYVTNPYYYIGLIEKWKLSGTPIRFFITGTHIDSLFSIEDFQYGEKDGTRDVSFVVNLKQYVVINAPSKVIGDRNKNEDIYKMNGVIDNVRPVEKEVPKTYTVKEGDTLWDIAKKLVGNGDYYRVIAEKNNLKNPNCISTGKVLQI